MLFAILSYYKIYERKEKIKEIYKFLINLKKKFFDEKIKWVKYLMK